MRSKLGTLLAASTLMASVIGLTSGPPAGAQVTLPNPNSNGITVVSGPTPVGGNARMLDVVVNTDAVYRTAAGSESKDIRVRIYLPAGYQTSTDTYPTLYLLHGGGDDWQAWSDTGKGNVASIVDATVAGERRFDGIVVMPEGGRTSWYHDWVGSARNGYSPAWETFHIDQLVPWIDANFRTTGNSAGRIVAGLSMGGFGALKYAQFTSLFSAVGSFSGGTDIRPSAARQVVGDSLFWFGASAAEHGGLLNYGYGIEASTVQQYVETVFGPEAGWGAFNPYDRAALYNAYDGRFGLYSGQTGTDANIGQWNDAFHDQLVAQGVDDRYCTGTGTHDWQYWRADLADFLDHVGGNTPATCPNGWGSPQ